MKKLKLSAAIAAALFPTFGVLPLAAGSTLEVNGGMVPAGALIPYLNQIVQGAAPGPATSLTSIAAGTALTAPQVINGIIKHTNTSGGTDTLPLAADIIAALPGASAAAKVGSTFYLSVLNPNTPGTVTLATNTGLTLAGTPTIAALQARDYFGQVTSSTQVTITELAGTTVTS